MTQRLLIIIGLLCLFSVAHAQDDATPIITAEELFADGVVYEESVPYAEQREIQWDDESREITYNDSVVISYPDYVEDVWYIRELDSGRYYVFTDFYITANNTFVLDVSDSSFSEPSVLCEYLVPDTYGYDGWAVYQSSIDGEFRLCEMATGVTSPPVPTSCEALPTNGGYPNMATEFPVKSPDEDWILFNSCEIPITFYSYEIASQRFVELGQADDHQMGYDLRWIDNYTVAFEFNTITLPSRNATYVADIREPDSLQFVVAQDYDRHLYFNNPPRYMWVDSGGGLRDGSVTEHTLYEYDITSREHREIMSFPCGDRQSNYSFDCAFLDNRAISYLAWANRDNLDYLIIYHSIYDGDIPTSITVLDATTHEELYYTGGFSFALRWIDAHEFSEFTTDTLVIARHPDVGWQTPIAELTYVSFESEPVVRTVSDFDMSEWNREFSHDARYFFTEQNPTETTVQYFIYDVITNEVIPLTNIISSENFSVYLDWQADYGIHVSIYSNGQRLNWNVTIPQLYESDT